MKSWILYGNIWVSIGAAALACTTCLLHHIAISPAMILLIFFSCLFVYNYHRIFRIAHIYDETESERHRWIIAHRNSLLVLTIISAAVSLVLFSLIINWFLVISAAPFILISFLYVVPLYRKNGHWRRLRDVPYLKVFLIAAVWSYVTVLLPLTLGGHRVLTDTSYWFTFAQRFLFIFAITLPFDVRDIDHDRHYSVKTFASVFGLIRLKQICHALLIGMLLLVYAGMQMGIYLPYHAAGLLTSAISSGWLINRLQEDSPEFYYTALLDGTMLDQLFWVWLIGLAAV